MVPMRLGLINSPFSPKIDISPGESCSSLKFQMAPRFNFQCPWFQEEEPISLSLKKPSKRIPSRFPNRAPMERAANFQGLFYMSNSSKFL
jgi:hypothetical protein